MRVALDAMGGDHAPQSCVAGAVLALREFRKLEKLFLVGDADRIRAELDKHGCRDARIEILHASQVVEMSETAVEAVRRKKDSSISRAVDLIKHGEADAVVSAGHTGAAVAATTIKLRTLEGVDRPGIAALLPTETNLCVLIDAGANTDARPEHMLQYAIMGAVFSRYVLGYKNPAIGLMSIGGEDAKGSDFTKDIFKLLRASGLNFRGNIEGHDLFQNPVEVVLCDGFTGNVVLKSCEATAEAVFHWLKNELKKTPLRMAGAMMAKGAFRAIKKRTNYEEYGGSPLLGVDGICIIAHGSSSPTAIKNAIRVAIESIQTRINPRIVEELAAFYTRE
ncbi:MAG: phosphate acyltransferase PlsX [Chthoniobacterales bacterium]|jgi:glycerol-3-phosphate acyltransferase PlsX|nr:phosphate acyltransferase PlsX [Chthoniobacterales bacterium]